MLRSYSAVRGFCRSRVLFSSLRGADPAVDIVGIRDRLEDYGVASSEAAKVVSEITPDLHDTFNRDWLRIENGSSKVVVRPRELTHLMTTLEYCNENMVAVCLQGGNTGLVGGSVPLSSELVLSTARMDRILSVDPESSVAVVEAGVVLEKLNEELAKYGMMAPYDLGAKGSCHVGGNVSTNAGGLRLLRYGSLHGSVLGLEVVLASGERLDLLKEMRKDNTGLDLKQLFIGAEGTLGVVTKVALQCVPLPLARRVAVLPVGDFSGVLRTLQLARECLGETLSAFEFFDDECVRLLRDHAPEVAGQLGETMHCLVETSGASEAHCEEKLFALVERLGEVEDALVSSDESQAAKIWKIRESITTSLGHDGEATYKYDVSLPVREFPEVVDAVRAAFMEEPGIVRVVGYGHVGDGNLHLNVTGRRWEDEMKARIDATIYGLVRDRQGSISAEHGIGSHKLKKLGYSKSDPAIRIMRQVKDLFDPKGILNPGKTIPSWDQLAA